MHASYAATEPEPFPPPDAPEPEPYPWVHDMRRLLLPTVPKVLPRALSSPCLGRYRIHN